MATAPGSARRTACIPRFSNDMTGAKHSISRRLATTERSLLPKPPRADAAVMLKIVKDSVLRVSRSLGYDIVPLREVKERDFALHLGELLRQLEIDCVLDVGAN